MNEKTYEGPERRKYFRYNVIYSPQHQANLKIGDRLFSILDYSERGLRFSRQDNFRIAHRIHGTVIYSNGKVEEIIGEIVWQTDKEIGLRFVD